MGVSGAGVLLHNKHSVLLVHQRVSKLWGLPKGGKNDGESNEECWRRELTEETSIDSSPFTPTISFDVMRYNISVVDISGMKGLQSIFHPIPKDNEITAAKWVPFNKIYLYQLNKVTRLALCKIPLPQDPFTNFRSYQRKYQRRVTGTPSGTLTVTSTSPHIEVKKCSPVRSPISRSPTSRRRRLSFQFSSTPSRLHIAWITIPPELEETTWKIIKEYEERHLTPAVGAIAL